MGPQNLIKDLFHLRFRIIHLRIISISLVIGLPREILNQLPQFFDSPFKL
jgi:hypothetical protein